MSKKRGELEVRIVYEGDDEEMAQRMRNWLISRLKEAPQASKLGFIGVAVYEGDTMVGFSTHGTPTPSAQLHLEETFDLKEAV